MILLKEYGMEAYALNGIDYFVMILYLVGTIAFGTYLGKNIRSGKDYFLAGRRLPWWAIGMSLVVSDIGAIDIVGIGGAAYVSGIVLGNFDWLGSVPVMVIAGMIFVPYLWRSQSYTIPEFLGKRYNIGVRSIMALIWGVFLATNLGVMLFATAKMLSVMLGWDINTSIIASAVAVGIYTLAGGLAAVVYTDVIQCIVMFGGCFLTLFLGLYEVGGFFELMDKVTAMGEQYRQHFNLVLPADTPTNFPWPGILFGLGFVMAPAYWFGNQAIMQRCLGASTEFEAKASMMWGSILKIFIPIVMVIPGIIALAYLPPVDDADTALPLLIRNMMPPGLLGIFFAAFLAAFMSSVDSCLNSAATLLTCDLYQRFIVRDGSDRHYLFVGRLITLFFIIFGVLFAIWIQNNESGIYNLIQTMLSLFQGPSLAILLFGVLWWRATGIGALLGLLGGLVTSLTLYGVNMLATVPIFQIQDPFLYISWWSFCVTVVLLIVISLLTPPEPEEKLVGLVYKYRSRNHASVH